MKNGKASIISDAAIVTALTVLLLVIAIYVPFFGMFAVLVAGTPLAYLMIKRGLGISITAFAAVILVQFIIMGDILGALVLGVVSLLPGLAVGFAVSRNMRFSQVLLAASVSALFGIMLELVLINAMSASGNGLEELLNSSMEMARGILQTAASGVQGLYESKGVDFAQTLDTMIDTAKSVFMMYFPSFVIVASAVVGYGVTMVTVFVLRRLRVRLVSYIPFYMIKAPKSMCYTAVVFFLLTLFSGGEGTFSAVLSNIVFILYAFIAVGGFSLIDYKFREKLSSGYKRALVYAAVLVIGYILMSFLLDILIILGMIDGVLDFRRIRAGE